MSTFCIKQRQGSNASAAHLCPNIPWVHPPPPPLTPRAPLQSLFCVGNEHKLLDSREVTKIKQAKRKWDALDVGKGVVAEKNRRDWFHRPVYPHPSWSRLKCMSTEPGFPKIHTLTVATELKWILLPSKIKPFEVFSFWSLKKIGGFLSRCRVCRLATS